MKAFEKGYDYYRLKKDCLGLKAGATFYHDKDDHELGSIAQGCLKIAYDATGNCDYGPCGDTYILHASAIRDTDFLELINIEDNDSFAKILLDNINVGLQRTENNLKSASPNMGSYFEGQKYIYFELERLIKAIYENQIGEKLVL